MIHTRIKRTLVGTAAGLSILFAVSACGGDPLAADPAKTGGSSDSVVVGSANFPESATVAEIYAGALNAAGVKATTKLNIGAREVYMKAVQDNSVTLVPDYSGNLLSYADPETTAVTPEEVIAALPKALPEGISVLDASKAEDKDSLVVSAATASKYNLKTIEDLAKVCKDISLGAPPEFATRSYGLPGLKSKYSCEPKKFTPIGDGGGPLTVKALMNDEVQVADIFTTSPSIPENKLVVLEDPKNNFLAQQVLPVVKTASVNDKAKEALNKVSSLLTTEDLIALNTKVSGSAKMEPAAAAAEWLKEKGITK